jgi:hypothetical protein
VSSWINPAPPYPPAQAEAGVIGGT